MSVNVTLFDWFFGKIMNSGVDGIFLANFGLVVLFLGSGFWWQAPPAFFMQLSSQVRR